MTLAIYIARRFLAAFGMVFGLFLGLMYLIELVEQVRRLAGTPAGFPQALELAALAVPSTFYRVLPLVTILAAVALFLALARSSELVAIRAAGRSALRTLVAPVVTALALGAVAVAVLNPIVAATSKEYQRREAAYTETDGSVLSVTREGLWLRQPGDPGHLVIHARRANADGTELFNVSFIRFDAAGRPDRRIEAKSARLVGGAWQVSGAKDWPLTSANPEQAATTQAELMLPSSLTAERIRDGFGRPEDLSIWDLPAFADALDAAGLSSRKHRVWIQTELALPLLLASMVLLGAGFTMRHVRFGRTGVMVLFAIIAGFGIFFLRNFAQVLGENGQIPAPLAAWSPPLAATLLSVGLLLHLEDG